MLRVQGLEFKALGLGFMVYVLGMLGGVYRYKGFYQAILRNSHV